MRDDLGWDRCERCEKRGKQLRAGRVVLDACADQGFLYRSTIVVFGCLNACHIVTNLPVIAERALYLHGSSFAVMRAATSRGRRRGK